MGFRYLGNTAGTIWGKDVYISGIPDTRFLKLNDAMKSSIKQTLLNRPSGTYTVFVSHSPAFVKELDGDLVDLQISGHTHGGQIFPFHVIAKKGIKAFWPDCMMSTASSFTFRAGRGAGDRRCGYSRRPKLRLFT